MGYKVGQNILIRTSYRDKNDKFILAGRPGVIVGREDSHYWPDYQLEVQMPDGPYIIKTHQSKSEGGFLLDTPQNRIKYPVPDWNQIDLKELHWPKLMRPSGIKVRADSFDGFISKIAEACGGIKTEYDIDTRYSWGHLGYNGDTKAQYMFPSPARVKAFWELLRWIEWYGKAKYKAGVKTGQNLLAQMARGELTGDMFEGKVDDEARMKSFEKHEW